MLDTLLEKLRAGERPKKRSNLRGTATKGPPITPLTFFQEVTGAGDGGDQADVGDMARGFLAALKGGEFRPDDILPIPMPTSPTKRRPTTRLKSSSLEKLQELVNNPDLLKSPELEDDDEKTFEFVGGEPSMQS